MLRGAPAIGLFLLAPLVAEFLLGNLPITLLGALVVLAPMYGGGALIIREATRRAHRGWPTIVVLALAYAVVEEAFTTQTLFNPDYLKLGLRLLEPAHIPRLGIGGWWTIYVLTLHTVWSVSTSVALAEAAVPDRSTTPWLGPTGLFVTAALFALGLVMTTLITLKDDPFVATISQFGGAALIVLVLVVVAFRLPPLRHAGVPGPVPGPRLVGAVALASGSAFLLVPQGWGWGAVAAYLGLDAIVIAAVARWSSRAAWCGRHRLALAGGAALAYAWHAFPQKPVMSNSPADIVGNTIFALGTVALIAVAARRQTGLSRGDTTERGHED
jgi:hypothetical protein